jgi:S1-C subfamily serine protease
VTRALLIGLLATILGASAKAGESGASRAQVVRQVMRSSVRVQVFSAGELARSATGVVVGGLQPDDANSKASFILTNAHVADPAELKDVTYTVLLESHGRVVKTLAARLTALGHVPELDLALLRVEEPLPMVQLGAEDGIDVGDEVVVVGAPYGRSLSVSGGLVSQLEAEDKPGALRFSAMKTDAAIGYGSSGGGVFEVPSGRLVGLVEGYRTARVNIDEKRSFDVPMPGETFVTPSPRCASSSCSTSTRSPGWRCRRRSWLRCRSAPSTRCRATAPSAASPRAARRPCPVSGC